jgi:hypothetical protein
LYICTFIYKVQIGKNGHNFRGRGEFFFAIRHRSSNPCKSLSCHKICYTNGRTHGRVHIPYSSAIPISGTLDGFGMKGRYSVRGLHLCVSVIVLCVEESLYHDRGFTCPWLGVFVWASIYNITTAQSQGHF